MCLPVHTTDNEWCVQDVGLKVLDLDLTKDLLVVTQDLTVDFT